MNGNAMLNGTPSVAITHDWLTSMRGGEKVLQALCRIFPAAPIWTLLYNRDSVSTEIARHPIFPSLLQSMPFASTRYREYLPLFPLFAELHKASARDLLISTSHAVAKAMVKRSHHHPYHVCYIHTPIRYAWDMFEDYFGVERVGWFLSRMFFFPILWMIRQYDKHTTDRVDLFVANSSYVAERVHRIYGREAIVLPPPVDVDRFSSVVREPEDWYLVVSALVPYKRVCHAVMACHDLKRKLKIIGSGPEAANLANLIERLGADVEMLGSVNDTELADHYRRARALIFPGIEDFGIVPVEAVAAGCPVIALAKGGILDSMTESTAVLYKDETVRGLADAILDFEARSGEFSVENMRIHARKFAPARFVEGFQKILEENVVVDSAPAVESKPERRAFSSLLPFLGERRHHLSSPAAQPGFLKTHGTSSAGRR